MELAIFLLLMILLAIAATRWGCDSRESINSAEWKRRREWELLHPIHHS